MSPTKRVKRSVRRRGRKGSISRDEELYLYSGFNLLDGSDAFEGEARVNVRKTWEAHRGRLLVAFVEAYPGSRPWAWWVYDAVEARRVLWSPDFLCDIEEPEVVYLGRLGLLWEGELERAAALGFGPVFDDERAYWDRCLAAARMGGGTNGKRRRGKGKL